MVTLQSTKLQTVWMACVIAILAVSNAGCSARTDPAGDPPTSAVAAETQPSTTEGTVSAPGQTSPTETVVDGEPGGRDQDPEGTGTTTADAPGSGAEPNEASDAVISDDEIAALNAVFESADGVEELPPIPAEGVDAYLGGSPDGVAAAAITLGLEQAGIDLSGITLSVLPITGADASLLVMELGEGYLDSGLPTEAEGSEITGALLALPEIESAAITELVTVYRGVDEEGPFTLTFVVPMDALRDAYESGGALGDALLVQVDRGS